MTDKLGKQAKSYTNLQRNLMSKLEMLASQQPRLEDLDELGFIRSQPKGVQELLQRAKFVTEKNQGKIKNTRLKLLNQQTHNDKNHGGGAFLTGVGLYVEKPPSSQSSEQEPEPQPATVPNQNMLHEVVSMKQDDLAQLRRMIRQTDSKLNAYGRELSRTKVNVMDAAGKIGRPINQALTYKIQKHAQFLPSINDSLRTQSNLQGGKRRYSSIKSSLSKFH